VKRTVLAVIFILIPASAYADPLPDHFILTGSGFGHGVGLSQVGAQGQAMEGKSANQILNYYFPGTQIVPVPDNTNIRVNIAHKVSSALFVAGKVAAIPTTAWSVNSGDGAPTQVPFASSLRFQAGTQGISLVITTPKAAPQSFPASSLWTVNFSGVLTVTTAQGTMNLRYGSIQLKLVGAKIEVTNTMSLHSEYLYGISEIPSRYLQAALQAQVIASRTYALSKVGTVRKECDCNIYSGIYDQNYIGYAKESEKSVGVFWKAAVDATSIDATSGIAIFYQGKPISVYFFASSAGTTQKSADVWGASQPYLVSVPDPWSLDIFLNPYYSHWQRVLIQKDVAAAFNLPDVLSLKIVGRTPTNSALSIDATSSTGKTSELAVGDFKVKLKIPSSWFEIINFS
jgi:SpoIID/LytB domain protein